jgi:hypothetical protein
MLEDEIIRRLTLGLAALLAVGFGAVWLTGGLEPFPESPTVFANIHAPDHARRGEEVPVTLTMAGPDGCVYVDHAEARVDEAHRLVTFHAELASRNGLCPQVVTYPEKVVTFKPRQTGLYSLRADLVPAPEQLSYTHLHLGIDFSKPYDIPVHVALPLRVD